MQLAATSSSLGTEGGALTCFPGAGFCLPGGGSHMLGSLPNPAVLVSVQRLLLPTHPHVLSFLSEQDALCLSQG